MQGDGPAKQEQTRRVGERETEREKMFDRNQPTENVVAETLQLSDFR